jgi:hypothetical protein
MCRGVLFCLDRVEVGDLNFYELKMVPELGFLGPERINHFPCDCLTLFRPFRTRSPHGARNLVVVSPGVPG